MRARYGVAALFVVVVAALIVVRDLGYLGGRTNGGPLAFDVATDGRTFTFTLDGDPVEVQDVRFRVRSPGLRVRGPKLPDGTLLEGARVEEAEGEGRLRLRAKRPGVYFALAATVDYRRGQRRFQTRFGDACIAVKIDVDCTAYDGPADAAVAEIGGPSRYPDARFEGGEAVFDAPATVRIVIANRTRAAIDVAALEGARPADFRLAPLDQRAIRLEVGCGEVDALGAELDGDAKDVPLSVPLSVRC